MLVLQWSSNCVLLHVYYTSTTKQVLWEVNKGAGGKGSCSGVKSLLAPPFELDYIMRMLTLLRRRKQLVLLCILLVVCVKTAPLVVNEMRALFLACFLLPSLGLAAADSSTTTDLLWPLPRSATFGSNVYSLNAETFTFMGTGAGGSSIMLDSAFERYTNLIFQTPAPFFPSGASSGAAQQELASLVVNVMSDNETLALGTNETCEQESDDLGVGRARSIAVPTLHSPSRGRSESPTSMSSNQLENTS